MRRNAKRAAILAEESNLVWNGAGKELRESEKRLVSLYLIKRSLTFLAPRDDSK